MLSKNFIVTFLSSFLVSLSLSAVAQDDAWVRNCNRSNNLAYCQEQVKSRSSGASVTQSAAQGAAFGTAMRQSMDAWDSFSNRPKTTSLSDFATPEFMAKQQADALAKKDLEKKLSTPEGRRDHYGSLKGKGDLQADYIYAIYADDSDGYIWMKKAADAGYPNAMYTLAFYHEQGLRGAKQDPTIWFQYIQKAAQAGQLTARALYGLVLANGSEELGITSKPAEGFAIVEDACKQMSGYACFVLGDFYQSGTGVKKDLSKAIAFYEQAQQINSRPSSASFSLEIEKPKAAFALAQLYASDDPVHGSKTKARSKLFESTNYPGTRYTEAWLEYAYALVLPKTVYEFPAQDLKRGFEILQWFADRNYKEALDFMGNIYLTGKHGVAKDTPRGISLLEKAASLNYPISMLRLAGHYVDLDDEGEKVAFKWVEKAANTGNPIGNWRLAQHYYGGMGVAKDIAKYRAAVSRACQVKHITACVELGDGYLNGLDGFPKDLALARQALEIADDQNSPKAALLLSISYLGRNAKTQDDIVSGIRYAFIAKERQAENADALLGQIASGTSAAMKSAYAQVQAEYKR
jgi:TPR repeat protein